MEERSFSTYSYWRLDRSSTYPEAHHSPLENCEACTAQRAARGVRGHKPPQIFRLISFKRCLLKIQRFGTEQKISFPEAKKIVEGVNRQPSFASVVAKKVVSVGCQTDPVEIRSATVATNVSAAPGSSSAKPNTSKDTSTAQNQPVIIKKTNVATTSATAPKPLANKDTKQAKKGKTQPHNIKYK